MTPLQKAAEARRYGQGTSKAAIRRRAERTRGRLHTGKPGDKIQMANCEYAVASDGSFRRVR